MSLRAFRLSRRRYAALDGAGARRAGGRWNSVGVSVVYAAESISLAALELLVNLGSEEIPDDLVTTVLDIPEEFVERLDPQDLPGDWRATPAPAALQALGDEWIRRGNNAVLSVPSAVVPTERNYALNPAHPDFGRIRPGKPEAFRFDPRLRSR